MRKQRDLPNLLHSLMLAGMVTRRLAALATLIAPEDHNIEIVVLLRRGFLRNEQSDP
jgi:hypothetical protein